MLLFWKVSGFASLISGFAILFGADDFSASGPTRLVVGFCSASIFAYYVLTQLRSTLGETSSFEYAGGEIQNAESTSGVYRSELAIRAACDADSNCLGYWQGVSGSEQKWAKLTSGHRTWKDGHPNKSVISVTVKKFRPSEYAAGELRNAEYTPQTYHSEFDVRAACDDDLNCLGYVQWPTNWAKLESGRRTWERGKPNDSVLSVMVKQTNQPQLACVNYILPPGYEWQQSCADLNTVDDHFEYMYNSDRGTSKATCGQYAQCFCCRRPIEARNRTHDKVSLSTKLSKALILPSRDELKAVGVDEWWLQDGLSAGMALGLTSGVISMFSVTIARLFLLWSSGYVSVILFQATMGALSLTCDVYGLNGVNCWRPDPQCMAPFVYDNQSYTGCVNFAKHSAGGHKGGDAVWCSTQPVYEHGVTDRIPCQMITGFQHLHLLLGAWVIISLILVLHARNTIQPRGNTLNNVAVAIFGSYVAVSGIAWAAVLRRPDYNDPTFFLHHSAQKLHGSYDILAIITELPWLPWLWWILLCLAVVRRCTAKVSEPPVIPAAPQSRVWSLSIDGLDDLDFDDSAASRMHVVVPELGGPATPKVTNSDLVAAAKDPLPGTLFLWTIVLLCLATIGNVSFVIDWHHSNIVAAGLYFTTMGYLLWNTAEFVALQLADAVVKCCSGFQEWPKIACPHGLPDNARTIVAYCLLSTDKEASKETWEYCLDAYLSNLDPNGNISAAVVSVTSDADVVEEEVKLRDWARAELRRTLEEELVILLANATMPAGNPRADFWEVLKRRAERRHGSSGEALNAELACTLKVLEKGLLYLHRNCRVLKKTGQYLDLMLLTYTGSNVASIYTDERYGKLGRQAGGKCFGFESNLDFKTKSAAEAAAQRARLEAAGVPDIEHLVMQCSSVEGRFQYTIVMDKDTRSEPGGILNLIKIAAREDRDAENEMREARHGCYSPVLLDDLQNPTWHMILRALRQSTATSTAATVFQLFGRHGFWGKGLFVHRLAVPLIARSELLPIDVLSHDTLEALALCPAYVHTVAFMEAPARNPVSALSQSTRWMVGEIKNHCHEHSPLAWLYWLMRHGYSLLANGHPYPTPFRRTTLGDIFASVSPGTMYLAHQAFRIMHSGPIILTNLFIQMFAGFFGLTFRGGHHWFNMLFYSLFVLFVFPKTFVLVERFIAVIRNTVARSMAFRNQSRSLGPGSSPPYQELVFTPRKASPSTNRSTEAPSSLGDDTLRRRLSSEFDRLAPPSNATAARPNYLLSASEPPSTDDSEHPLLEAAQTDTEADQDGQAAKTTATDMSRISTDDAPTTDDSEGAFLANARLKCSQDVQPLENVANSLLVAHQRVISIGSPERGEMDFLLDLDTHARGQSEATLTNFLVAKTCVLCLIDTFLSTIVFSPECLHEVVRMTRAARAFITSIFTWKPQDTVEREVEQNISINLVLSEFWYVVLVFSVIAPFCFLTDYVPVSPSLVLLLASWLLYPLVAYVLCLPVTAERRREFWFCRWIDETLASTRELASRGSGSGGFVALCGAPC